MGSGQLSELFVGGEQVFVHAKAELQGEVEEVWEGRVTVQLSKARQQPFSTGLHVDADSGPGAVSEEPNELCVGASSVLEVPTARVVVVRVFHDATVDGCRMRWWSQKRCRVVGFKLTESLQIVWR